jgi:hypothetical protein
MAEACNMNVTEQQKLTLRELLQLLVIYGMRHATGTMLPAIKCQIITCTFQSPNGNTTIRMTIRSLF